MVMHWDSNHEWMVATMAIHVFHAMVVYILQGVAPKIAKLVYNSNNYCMVYGTYNYSIHGVYKPTFT